jgi:hypothetical protein
MKLINNCPHRIEITVASKNAKKALKVMYLKILNE